MKNNLVATLLILLFVVSCTPNEAGDPNSKQQESSSINQTVTSPLEQAPTATISLTPSTPLTITSTTSPSATPTLVPSPTPSLPDSCFDQDATQHVLQEFLEGNNYASLEEGIMVFKKETRWEDKGGGTNNDISSEYSIKNNVTSMMILGTFDISLETSSYYQPGDFAVCALLVQPGSVKIFPIIAGIQMGKSWEAILTGEDGLLFRNHSAEELKSWLKNHKGDSATIHLIYAFNHPDEISKKYNWTNPGKSIWESSSLSYDEVFYDPESNLNDNQTMDNFVKIASREGNYLYRFTEDWMKCASNVHECLEEEGGRSHKWTDHFDEVIEAIRSPDDIGVFAYLINTQSSYLPIDFKDPLENSERFFLYQDSVSEQIDTRTMEGAEYDFLNLYASHQGEYGIRITTAKTPGRTQRADLVFDLQNSIDLNEYQWLEFYFKPHSTIVYGQVSIQDNNGKEISKFIWNDEAVDSSTSFSDLMSPRGLLPDGWQQVRIPMSFMTHSMPLSDVKIDFYFLSVYGRYALMRHAGGAITKFERINVDLDGISLVK